MQYLLLITLFLAFMAAAQEKATGVEEASSRLDESDNATLLKTYKLAEPTTGGSQNPHTDPGFLSERVVVSPVPPSAPQDRGGFLCPDGTDAACLETGDKLCPGSTRCVSDRATCFDEYPCDLSEGFVCASEYDDILNKLKQVAREHDELASENVALRARRLEQRNCVINAATLKDAIRCVRQS